MPSKLQVDENLVFLYRCLLHSDCKTIDFSAVAAATNLKAPAARMRYSRLKKNIETTIGYSSLKGPAASTKAPIAIKSIPGPSKKRKLMLKSEDRESELTTLHEEIGSVMMKDEELQEWIARPRTRGKKIDLKDAFDSDSSTGPGLRNRDDGSSDDYKTEDVSDDDEEFRADEDDVKIDQTASPRRKSSSQSVNRNLSTARSSIRAFRKSSNQISRSVANNDAEETAAKPKVPVTPESGISGPRVTKEKSLTLPPTPHSMPNRLKRQKTVHSTSISLQTRTGTIRPSPVARPNKVRNTTPQPSLFDRIEKARIQADYNLSSLSRQANKIPQPPSYSAKTDGENILQSIEHDEEEEDGDDDRAKMDASSKSSSRYYSINAASAADGDERNGEGSEFATRTEPTRTERNRSSTSPSSLTVKSESIKPARAAAASMTQPASTIQASPSSLDSCIVL